jgi:hypothetical protein
MLLKEKQVPRLDINTAEKSEMKFGDWAACHPILPADFEVMAAVTEIGSRLNCRCQ